jgi:hypothetical protein
MSTRAAFAAIAFLAVTAFTTPALAQCVRATLDEPFLLPDGSWHRAGLLRICLDRAYSPVAGLHTIQAVDGGTRTYLSRHGLAEAAVELRAPRILFARDGRRTLTLLGYAVATEGGTRIYWIRSPR